VRGGIGAVSVVVVVVRYSAMTEARRVTRL
jgi:hypothetical protein